ncbi:MAG: hypothetical protein HYX27_02095 [Acidobacteria bacterium]|nr:hypothetical protein [Acidobacteriota bacterium]
MAYELTALIGVGSPPPGSIKLPQNAWLLPLMDEDHNAAELSFAASVACITAEFCGGAGAQTATLYVSGREQTKFETGYQAINDAPHALGITAEPPKDAFDTLGLGRYRRTEDWLREAMPPPSP